MCTMCCMSGVLCWRDEQASVPLEQRWLCSCKVQLVMLIRLGAGQRIVCKPEAGAKAFCT